MDEAARVYSATSFTIFANPHLGNVAIRFPVPHDTNARRPTPPTEGIRPTQWNQVVAEVMSDNFDELHMTWKWPADPGHLPQTLIRLAQDRSQPTGETIEVR